MKQQSVWLMSNPFLMIGSFAVTIGVAICAIGVIVLVGVDGAMSSPEAVLPVQISISILLAIFVIAIVASSPRACAIVVFSKDSITHRILFCKQKSYPYRHYPYIYKASYFHGNIMGVGYQVDFIVFSSKPLSKEDCLNANALSISEDLIKIRYRKKVYQKLYNILPVSHQMKITKAFGTRGRFCVNPSEKK